MAAVTSCENTLLKNLDNEDNIPVIGLLSPLINQLSAHN